MNNQKPSLYAYLICLLGAAFYIYEFALQVSISVMTDHLMHDLLLNAATLSIVSSFYYYAYTFMQVPAGMLHDRFGPHFVLTSAIIVCSLGAFIFSYSDNMLLASLARFSMGLGAAFSFTGALILITHWFPVHYFPVLSGFVQLMSAVGAIFGTFVLSYAVNQWDWRPTMFYLAIMGFLLAITVWATVRDYPKHRQYEKINEVHHSYNFKFIITKMQSWWIALYSFLVWVPIVVFAALWGIPFLVTAYHMSVHSASLACAAIWIGIGVSAPAIGYLSELSKRRCTVLALCAAAGLIGTFLLIYWHVSYYAIYLLLFMIGIGGSGQSLAFSVVRDINPPRVMGAAVGLNNMATVAGGALIQPLVGWLLYGNHQLFSQNTTEYTLHDYRTAFLIMPLCYLLALVISLVFIKETHCELQYY